MSELDSFFAKKDKKKVKKGKKFTTTDEIAKRLEDTEKKSEKSIIAAATEHAKKEELIIAADAAAARDTDSAPPVVEEVVKETKVHEEEVWNDFKDDTTVDVSNLKITKLNIEEEDEGRGDSKDEYGGDNDEDKKDGVWKVEEQKSIQTTICDAVDAGLDNGLEEVKATVAAMANNTRWSSQMSKDFAASPLPRGSGASAIRRKKIAPDINNSMAFPSLADAQATASRKNKGDENSENRINNHHAPTNVYAARDSGNSGAYKPPMFRTNNRFGALTDHSGRNS